MTAALAFPPRPSVPCPFVCGSVDVPANQAVSLLSLIQNQVTRDCPGTSTQFTLSASPTNMAPVWLGAFMQIAGALTIKSFGSFLTPMGEPRIYRSSYPGTQTPIGLIQVFSEAPAKLHIEVVE